MLLFLSAYIFAVVCVRVSERCPDCKIGCCLLVNLIVLRRLHLEYLLTTVTHDEDTGALYVKTFFNLQPHSMRECKIELVAVVKIPVHLLLAEICHEISYRGFDFDDDNVAVHSKSQHVRPQATFAIDS